MEKLWIRHPRRWLALKLALAIAILPFTASAQTPIKLHSNKFSAQDDVKLGREAAAEAEQKMQLVRDPELAAYVERVGERLAVAIPTEFQHAEFQYYFKVVNARDINAFALPGGPMYVNSGMIVAAKTEDEMAGVMAHEISHVALRHGTAQVTKQQKYSMLSGIMGMGGQILGGPIGSVAQMGAQGVGVYLLKFSREYETEADLLGARIMANAGYDPRELAKMFQTIESQGGGGGPSFLSDHPSPKDRYARINQEAQSLTINTAAAPDKHDFMVAQQRLTGRGGNQTFTGNQGNQAYMNQGAQPPNSGSQGMQPPNSGNQVMQPPNSGNQGDTIPAPTGRVAAPSAHYQTFNKGAFSVSIPDNWRELEQQNGVWYAPEGAFGSANGQTVFTHGVNLGAAQTQAQTSQQAADEFIKPLTQGGALRAHGGYERIAVDGRESLLITLDNVNEATGRPELVNVVTTKFPNGQLFYLITVCPKDEYKNYQGTFLTILRSLKFSGR